MIVRSSKMHAKSLIKETDRVIDLGCKKEAWPESDTVVDIDDYSEYYKSINPPKKFIQADACNTPFEDDEFDFSICSHIIEHIITPAEFLNELSRISKSGYIEFPTLLGDNLIRGNETEHKWFVTVDDVAGKLIFTPKVQIIPAIFTAREAGFLEEIFPNNLTTAIYWEGKIDFEINHDVVTPPEIPKFWKVLPKMAKILRLLKLHKSY